jgi:hypothetical protein
MKRPQNIQMLYSWISCSKLWPSEKLHAYQILSPFLKLFLLIQTGVFLTFGEERLFDT